MMMLTWVNRLARALGKLDAVSTIERDEGKRDVLVDVYRELNQFLWEVYESEYIHNDIKEKNNAE